MRYPAEASGYSQQQKRRSYPKPRADFLPPAYALLTWEIAPGTKERYGQDHKEGCRSGGSGRPPTRSTVIHEKLLVNERAIATAGLAKDVEAVNQYAAVTSQGPALR